MAPVVGDDAVLGNKILKRVASKDKQGGNQLII